MRRAFSFLGLVVLSACKSSSEGDALSVGEPVGVVVGALEAAVAISPGVPQEKLVPETAKALNAIAQKCPTAIQVARTGQIFRLSGRVEQSKITFAKPATPETAELACVGAALAEMHVPMTNTRPRLSGSPRQATPEGDDRVIRKRNAGSQPAPTGHQPTHLQSLKLRRCRRVRLHARRGGSALIRRTSRDQHTSRADQERQHGPRCGHPRRTRSAASEAVIGWRRIHVRMLTER